MTYRKQELLFGLALLLIGSGLMYHTFDPTYAAMAADISVGPMFFPRMVLTIWLVCSLGIIVHAYRAAERTVPFAWRKVLAALGVLLFFALFFSTLGFLPVGICCFFGLAWILEFRKPGILLGISVGYVLLVDFVFRVVLKSYLPGFSPFGV